ncbi:MAG: hypothetical protein ACTSX7_09755 [Alphaproteobacteria bacterium]
MMPELGRPVGRPGGDVAVHVLADNSAVVFNEATQQLFSFDALATYLWCRWEDGAKPAELAGALDITAGVGGETAQEMVDRCLTMWQQNQLIGDDRGGERNGMTTRPAVPGEAGDAAASEASTHGEQPLTGLITTDLQIGGESYRLCYGSQDLVDMVQPSLAHLEKANQGMPATEFLLRAEADRFELWQGGDIVEHCDSADEVPPMVKFCLNVDMLEYGRYVLAFHSAAVVWGERALLLPAASGRGKSTLTAALLHDGWGYLTDDSALLGTGDPGRQSAGCDIRGVGFDLCLKESAWPLLQPLFPTIDAQPIYRRGDGHRVRYLPPSVRLPDPARAYPIEWIVFPRFEPESGCSLQPMATTAALQHLLREAFAPSQKLSRHGFKTLARLVEDKRCYALTYGSLEMAVGSLGQLCR